MEKIKITIEQEEAFKKFKGSHSYKMNFLLFINSKGFYGKDNPYYSLNSITPEQFALLLFGWYEVEQPFKVGDWLYDEVLLKFGKVSAITGSIMDVSRVNPGTIHYSLNAGGLKKVTEPWKIMLLEFGREKPEFKAGDIVETESDCYCVEEDDEEDFFEEVIMLFEQDLVKAFHAAENRIEVPKNV